MTVGKDVGILFTDVVKSMQTDDIELKKLIYLYIINYARSQQDKSILVVNTLQRDAAFPNPLVRALAIRTMGCLRVDAIVELRSCFLLFLFFCCCFFVLLYFFFYF